MRVKGQNQKIATLNNFHFLLDILIIFGSIIYQVQMMCHLGPNPNITCYIGSEVSHTKMTAVPCLLLELSPMNEFVVDIIYTCLSVRTAYHKLLVGSVCGSCVGTSLMVTF